MARTRNRITIDDKIKKQEDVVLKAKSDRSSDDILAYINSENPDNNEED